MVFSSSIFLFAFLPAVLLVYYLPLRRWRTGQNVFLFLASLFFYGWGAHEALLLMLGSILANDLLGLWAGRARSAGRSVRPAVVLAAEAADILWELRDGKRIVAGPGLSRRCATQVLEALLAPKGGRPASLVLDADALNILAEHRELLAMAGLSCVLTPHPGEARRLLGRELTDPVSDARALAALGGELGCKVVLKGASRVVCEGAPVNGRAQPVFISATGGPGMAKGGSGDVFAGLLAGLRCCEWGNIAAACEVHGLAGALAEEKYGDTAMTSRDLLEMLPEAFRRLAARREEQP